MTKGIVSRLILTGTDYYFQFDMLGSDHSADYWPDANGAQHKELAGPWGTQLQQVGNFLEGVKPEIEAPDLWESIAGATRVSGAADRKDNEPLDADEQRTLVGTIDEIETYLTATVELSDPAQERVRRDLDYVKDAVTRLGRRDWLMFTVGQLTTLVIDRVVPADSFPHMLSLLWGAVQLVFTGISDLLAPDGTFIHPRAAERTKFCSAHNRPAPEAVTSAHADVEPTGAAAFRAFLRHRSTLVPFLRQPSLHSAARQPAGTGSAQILRSISPKSRRFR